MSTEDRARELFRRVVDTLEGDLGRPSTDWPIAAEKVSASDPLDVLVETILSQNTTDTNSHAAFLELKKRWPTWKEAVAADTGDIEDAIKQGGLSKIKSKNIKRILEDLAEKRKDEDGTPTLVHLRSVADDEAVMAELTAMRGVGPKTAACVLLFGLGRDRFPVDTHIFRVAVRIGLISGPDAASRESAQVALETLCPTGRKLDAHLLLIEHGRRTCKAKPGPLCSVCPLDHFCSHVGVPKSSRR